MKFTFSSNVFPPSFSHTLNSILVDILIMVVALKSYTNKQKCQLSDRAINQLLNDTFPSSKEYQC